MNRESFKSKPISRLCQPHSRLSSRLRCSHVKKYTLEHVKRSKQVIALMNIEQTTDLVAQRNNLPELPDHGPVKGQVGKLFVFGLGYVGLGLATQLRAQGWHVLGTSRTEEKQKELREQGFETFIFDSDRMSLGLGKKGLAALREATHLLVAFSPSSPEGYCPIMWILGREYKFLRQNLRWIGYLSSTSVYGNHNGDWVDEECELRAERGNGAARAVSEDAWLYFGDVTGLPVHVFRLAGIYGPGRNAIEAAKRGGHGKRDGKKYTSRCHVHDICKVLMVSMAHPIHGEVYNVADDDPSNRETVIKYVKEELWSGIGNGRTDRHKKDVFGEVEEKRVSNAKLKKDLGVALDFPTFREGLQAIHEGNNTPFE